MEWYLISQNLFSFADDSEEKIHEKMIRNKPRLTIRKMFSSFTAGDTFTISKVNSARLNHHDVSKNRLVVVSSARISQNSSIVWRSVIIPHIFDDRKKSSANKVNIGADNTVWSFSSAR